MEITSVSIKKMEGEGTLKAMASITIDDEFVVTGIKVIEGAKGVFVSMPSRKGNDGEYHDIAFHCKAESRTKVVDAVMEAYNK
jgi:stage V sporulation protein G